MGPVELRVEELAARGHVSVDTIRYYQARGLLHPPLRRGRVALYDGSHVERLGRIRVLQQRGFSLATIARVLNGQLDEADQALVRAVVAETAPASETALLTMDQLADRTGVPMAVLQALANEGLLVPLQIGDRRGYTEDDVAAARAGLRFLEWGVPLSALLAVATEHHQAVTQLARHAVALFDDHVRARLRSSEPPGASADAPPAPTGDLAEAFHVLLAAATTVVQHHFTRVLLAEAMAHIEHVGADLEREAARGTSAAPTGGRASTGSAPPPSPAEPTGARLTATADPAAGIRPRRTSGRRAAATPHRTSGHQR